VFVWKEGENFGTIDLQPIKITATENLVSKTKLPFSFKIKIENEITFNFEENVFLELDV
jgi:hypothetical protein